jgi:archaellum component FlaC
VQINTDSSKNYFFSFALVSISVALAYLAYALVLTVNTIPTVMVRVDKLEKQLPLIVAEFSAYRKIIPDIIVETQAYRAQIPAILTRIDDINEQVKALRTDIPYLLDKNLPPVLAKTETLQQQINDLYLQLPAILASVERSILVLENSNKQIANVVDSMPLLLAESQAIRAAIPGYLDQAEYLVNETKNISEDAGKGMFTGIIKGIISTPFALLNAPRKMLGSGLDNPYLYTDEDYELVYKTTAELLGSKNLTSKTWRNPKSKNQGKVVLGEIYNYKNMVCRIVTYHIQADKGQRETLMKDMCLNSESQWQLVEK